MRKITKSSTAGAVTEPAGPAQSADEHIFGRNFLLAGAATFGFFVASFMYFPTLPLYIEARGGSQADISLVIGAAGIMSLFARPVVGWLVDGVGRRAMLMAGTAIAAGASLFLAFAVTLPLIIVGRLFHGAALATVTTAGVTLINDIVPQRRRGEANSYFGMAINIATGLGPPVGAYLVIASFLRPAEQALSGVMPTVMDAGNFSVMFLTGALLALLALLMASLVHDSYHPKGIRRLPSMAGMFRRETVLPAVLSFSMTVPFACVLSLVPLYARDHGLVNPGLFFTVSSGMMLMIRVVSGRASDRFGRPKVFLPGLALVGISMLVMNAATSPPMLLLAAALYGTGVGTAQPTLMAYAADLAPLQVRGAAMSTFSLGFDLGLSLGAWALGLVATAWGMGGAFLAAGVSPFLGIAFFLIRTRLWRSNQISAA